MPTFISLLRGINVSGHKKVPMAELKALYESLNFKNITTYIQSGNVVFTADKIGDDRTLAQQIEKGIIKSFHFEVPVIVRREEELQEIIFKNPFVKNKEVDIEKLHVTFLEEEPNTELLNAIKTISHAPDSFEIRGKEVYLYCPGGYGNTKLTNTFFENKLKVKATTRNWKTVNKLVALAKEE